MTDFLKAAGATSALALSIIASIAPAQAQTASETRAAALEEILVTAQKRAESVQDVPISMSVIGGVQVEKFNTPDLQGLMNTVPNMFVQRLNAADVVYIRGFGSAPANFAFDQSVSLYQDGIYGGRGRQFESPFFDVERIEVLRGPQGALFGKNTPAGAISVATRNPTKTFEGSVTGSYNFDLDGMELSGFVSGPLSDTLSARVAVKLSDHEGYIFNHSNGKKDPSKKRELVRLTLRYEPSADMDVTAKFEHANSMTKGANIVLGSPTVRGQITKDRYSDSYPFGFGEELGVESNNASMTANIPLGNHTLTSVTGYSSFKAHRANSYSIDVPAIYSNRIYEDFHQLSQELRLLSPVDQRFEYIVGVYVDYSKYDLYYPTIYQLTTGISGEFRLDFTQKAYSYSAFGQGTFNITDDFRAIGSLRYTHTDKDGDFSSALVNGDPWRAITSASGKISEGNVDPSFTLQYDINDDIMLYAVYGRGSKSGGFVSNTAGTTNATFKFRPEKSENFEGGFKASFLQNRVILNASAYYTKFDDLQISSYDSSRNMFVTNNAAKASARGVEFSLGWLALDDLEFNLSGAYNDAKYDDYPGASCLARQTPAQCTSGNPASVAANNIAGSPLTYSSKWTGSLQGIHTLNISENLKINSTLVASYRSKYYNADNQSPIYGIQKGFVKIDARVQLGDQNDRWNIAVIGKNLTDKTTYNFSFLFGAPLTTYPAVHHFVDEPRTIAVEGTLKF